MTLESSIVAPGCSPGQLCGARYLAARYSLGIDLLEERLNLCERDADRAGHPVKSNLTKKNYRAKQSGVTSKWEMSATEITGDDIKACGERGRR